MDGHFVPEISFGEPVMRSVSAISDLFVDAHLMVYNPADHVEAVAKGGAQMLTFHYEVMPGGAFAYGGINDPDMAIEEAARLIGKIHESGMKAGISIKPKTPWEVLTPLIPLVDLVLVMSVEPGFGGQKFIPESLERIRAIREEANRINTMSKQCWTPVQTRSSQAAQFWAETTRWRKPARLWRFWDRLLLYYDR